MRERVSNPSVLIPIFHQGEDFNHLINMLNYEPRIECIGISPANDLSNTRKKLWLDKVYKLVRDRKTHVFGMTALNILEQYPIWSADSISWVLTAGFGNILITQNGKYSSIHVSEQPQELILELEDVVENCRRWGIDPAELSISAIARRTYNYQYLTEWAKNYEYKPLRKQKSLF